MKSYKKTLIKYSVTTAAASAVAVLSLYLGGYSTDISAVEKYKMLCNAFTIPAILLIMLGCLVAISTSGFFDMLSYAFSRAAHAFIPGGRKADETFADYKEKKAEARFSGYSFLIVVGLAFLIVAIVFMILFYRVY